MIELCDRKINDMIVACNKIGVILDYIILKCEASIVTYEIHRQVALRGMEIIDKRLELLSLKNSNHYYPIENFFRVKVTDKEISGKRIMLKKFWGSDDALPKATKSGSSWIIPNADGYKTAFFNPPHGLNGTTAEQLELFNGLNDMILVSINDDNLEIYEWPNNWSNYFNAGKEWWGTFYWTIYNREKRIFVIIAGSKTD